MFEDVGKLSKIINAIHAAGSGCAMDDFGSGYASLNLIQNIPPPARSFEYAFHQQVQHRHAQQYSPRRQTLLPALLGAGAGHRIQYNPLRGKRLEGPVRFQQVHSLVSDNRSQRHTFHPSRLRQLRIAGYGLRGYSYGNGFSTPTDAQWLADYKRGRGSFGEHFRPALNTFQTMIDTGVWKKSDLSLTYAERETMLFNHQCAMVEDSVLMARRGVRPHRLHRSVRAHAFLQPRHPLRLGPPLYGVLYRFEQTSGRTPEQKEIRSRHAVDGLHQHAGRAARPGSEHGGHVFQRKESPRAGYPGNCGHAPGLEPRAVRHLS